jgi:hypothetical protein
MYFLTASTYVVQFCGWPAWAASSFRDLVWPRGCVFIVRIEAIRSLKTRKTAYVCIQIDRRIGNSISGYGHLAVVLRAVSVSYSLTRDSSCRLCQRCSVDPHIHAPGSVPIRPMAVCCIMVMGIQTQMRISVQRGAAAATRRQQNKLHTSTGILSVPERFSEFRTSHREVSVAGAGHRIFFYRLDLAVSHRLCLASAMALHHCW